MPIVRNTNQSRDKDLNCFYTELTQETMNPNIQIIGRNMLAFIEMVNQTFLKTTIWGLTSMYRLILQTEDQWDSEWFVIINCIGNNEYHFEYLMPENKKPWDYATVTGVARDLAESKQYLLIAMKESGGWADNDELSKLLSASNIY